MNDTVSESTVDPVANGSTGVTVRVFGRTDVGLVREHNEDNFLIADLTAGNRSIKPEVRTHEVGEQGTLFVVCDGMGGAAAGEVASRIGVDTIYEMMSRDRDPADPGKFARRLDEAIREAGTRIYTAARLNRGQRGMGTTVTAAVLAGERLVLGQVGDSRAYVVRHGRLVQVTKDQSLVQQLIDAKQLTEEEARNFERSNIILQALGTAEDVHVDVTSVVLRRGDALVMCSDGLSGLVEADEILAVVDQHEDPMEACRLLTEAACAHGGEDNITVIVARFDGEGLEPPGEGDDPHYEKYDFPRVTETTVRTPMPKPPVDLEAADASPAGGCDAAEAARDAAAVAEREPAPGGSTVAGPAAGEPAGGHRLESAGKPRSSESRSGRMLLVLVVLAVVGVAAAWFGGAFETGDAAEPPASEVPSFIETPAAPVTGARPPEPERPREAPAVREAPPPLAPVDPEDIARAPDHPAAAKTLSPEDEPAAIGAGVEPADVAKEPESGEAVAEGPRPEVDGAAEEQPKKSGSEPGTQASSKKPGKKPGSEAGGTGSAIPDNPF